MVRYLLVAIIFILGLPLGVASIPFALVYCIYRILRDCCFRPCCVKTKNRLEAEERIRQLTVNLDDDDAKKLSPSLLMA